MSAAPTSPPAESDEEHTTEPPAWQQMFIAEDGSVFYDTDARQSASKHIAQNQEEHVARLRRLTPAARRVYATYKRTGVLPLPVPRPPTRARSSRGPAPVRHTGSRRGGTRSPPSSSDDDPHESDLADPRPFGPGLDGTGQRLRRGRVQLQLDVGDIRSRRDRIAVDLQPRLIVAGISGVLRELIPSPAAAHELCELSSPERATLYRLAGIRPLEQITYEENLRRWRRAAR
jgi:hypothetical protein